MKGLYTKQYKSNKVLARAFCKSAKGSKWLVDRKIYYIIDVTETQYLVRFPSGGAKWYSKARFEVLKKVADAIPKTIELIPPPNKKPVIIQLKLNI